MAGERSFLHGIHAFIDVASTDDRASIADTLESLGAKVSRTFINAVTHVIFDGGKQATLDRAAMKDKCVVVSPKWVKACEKKGVHCPETDYPIHASSEDTAAPSKDSALQESLQVYCEETQFQFDNSDAEVEATPPERTKPAEKEAKKTGHDNVSRLLGSPISSPQPQQLTESDMDFLKEASRPIITYGKRSSPMTIRPAALLQQSRAFMDDTTRLPETLDVSVTAGADHDDDVVPDTVRRPKVASVKTTPRSSPLRPAREASEIPSSPLSKASKDSSTSKSKPAGTTAAAQKPERIPEADSEEIAAPKSAATTTSRSASKQSESAPPKRKLGAKGGQQPKLTPSADTESNDTASLVVVASTTARHDKQCDSATSKASAADKSSAKTDTSDSNQETTKSKATKKGSAQTYKQAKSSKLKANPDFLHSDEEAEGGDETYAADKIKTKTKEKSASAKPSEKGSKKDKASTDNTEKDAPTRPETKAADATSVTKKVPTVRTWPTKDSKEAKEDEDDSKAAKKKPKEVTNTKPSLEPSSKARKAKKPAPVDSDDEKGLDDDDNTEDMIVVNNKAKVKAKTKTASATKRKAPNQESPSSSRPRLVDGKVTVARRIVISGLSDSERDIVFATAEHLGDCEILASFTPDVTHVVSSGTRTLKVLNGITHGCWIVSVEWVMKSLEAGAWVEEEPYELHSKFPAAQQSRLERTLAPKAYKSKLFQGKKVFIGDETNPAKDKLQALIEGCSGKVVEDIKSADAVISGQPIEACPSSTVSTKWVFDSIAESKLLPLKDFVIAV